MLINKVQRNNFFLNYPNFLLLKLNDCIKNIDARQCINDENNGFTEFYIPFGYSTRIGNLECRFRASYNRRQKKSPQSFDEAINFLVGGVDGYHRSRWIYQIAVVLLVSPPLLLKD